MSSTREQRSVGKGGDKEKRGPRKKKIQPPPVKNGNGTCKGQRGPPDHLNLQSGGKSKGGTHAYLEHRIKQSARLPEKRFGGEKKRQMLKRKEVAAWSIPGQKKNGEKTSWSPRLKNLQTQRLKGGRSNACQFGKTTRGTKADCVAC